MHIPIFAIGAMKKYFIISVLLIFLSCAFANAQKHGKPAPLRELEAAGGTAAPTQAQNGSQPFMHYTVDAAGDTVYLDVIQPAWVFPKGSKINRIEWRRYCKLVYNFNKVYPYALLGKRLVTEVDTNIEQQHMKRGQKDRYINQMQWQLLHDFEGAIRHMTISQGQLLVRLVDREIGKTSYNIVKDYKSGIAAGFWQGIAKLFGQNLKNHYDPDGEDKQTEELVRAWERGEFDELYFSVFFEWPKKTELPSEYR